MNEGGSCDHKRSAMYSMQTDVATHSPAERLPNKERLVQRAALDAMCRVTIVFECQVNGRGTEQIHDVQRGWPQPLKDSVIAEIGCCWTPQLRMILPVRCC